MIRVQATGQRLRVLETQTIVAGSRGIYFCTVELDGSWDGLDVTVTFRGGAIAKRAERAEDGSYKVPWECLVKGHSLAVGVTGTQGSTVEKPTLWADLGPILSGSSQGGDPDLPPTNVYNEILRTANNAVEVANAADIMAAESRESAENAAIRAEAAEASAFQAANDAAAVKEAADNGAFIGETGPQGPNGDTGPAGERGPRGYSGLVPAVSISWAAEVTVPANTKSSIATLEGATTITLGEPVEGYDNEWPFVVAQGETAYDIVLPVIEWHGGYAPVFGANSRTEVRLWDDGDVLKGVWL